MNDEDTTKTDISKTDISKTDISKTDISNKKIENIRQLTHEGAIDVLIRLQLNKDHKAEMEKVKDDLGINGHLKYYIKMLSSIAYGIFSIALVGIANSPNIAFYRVAIMVITVLLFVCVIANDVFAMFYKGE